MMRFFLVFFIFFVLFGQAEAEKPCRKECIFRVDLDWTGFKGNKQDALKAFVGSVVGARNMGFNEVPPSASIQGDKQQYIFFQLTDGCGKKRIDNARRLLDQLGESSLLPSYKINKQKFHPGVETIDVEGRWWR
tara:strand:+ start:513 stop:914 length:402 start_codon:yes stop_codon:yes gene_type:complete